MYSFNTIPWTLNQTQRYCKRQLHAGSLRCAAIDLTSIVRSWTISWQQQQTYRNVVPISLFFFFFALSDIHSCGDTYSSYCVQTGRETKTCTVVPAQRWKLLSCHVTQTLTLWRNNHNVLAASLKRTYTLTSHVSNVSSPAQDSQAIKEQLKLKAKQKTNGIYGFGNPVALTRNQAYRFLKLRSSLFFPPLPKKESRSWDTRSLFNHKHSQTDWRLQGGLICMQNVLTLPTNLHRALPCHRLRSAGRPPFLGSLIHCRTWSQSSRSLGMSGPWLPRCCDKCRSRSRWLDLRRQIIVVSVIQAL